MTPTQTTLLVVAGVLAMLLLATTVGKAIADPRDCDCQVPELRGWSNMCEWCGRIVNR